MNTPATGSIATYDQAVENAINAVLASYGQEHDDDLRLMLSMLFDSMKIGIFESGTHPEEEFDRQLNEYLDEVPGEFEQEERTNFANEVFGYINFASTLA